jgi:hypothetical protein
MGRSFCTKYSPSIVNPIVGLSCLFSICQFPFTANVWKAFTEEASAVVIGLVGVNGQRCDNKYPNHGFLEF